MTNTTCLKFSAFARGSETWVSKAADGTPAAVRALYAMCLADCLAQVLAAQRARLTVGEHSSLMRDINRHWRATTPHVRGSGSDQDASIHESVHHV